MDIINQIIRYEEGDMDQEEIIDFFQGLVDTGVIHSLQGSYGRTAQELIDAGLIRP